MISYHLNSISSIYFISDRTQDYQLLNFWNSSFLNGWVISSVRSFVILLLSILDKFLLEKCSINFSNSSEYCKCLSWLSNSNGTLLWIWFASCSSNVLLLGNTLSLSKANIFRCCWLKIIRVRASSSRIDLTMLMQSRSLKDLSSPSLYIALFLMITADLYMYERMSVNILWI